MQLLLSLLAVFASVDAGAKLLVGKNFISKYALASNENVFEYEIINKGDSTAINVVLDDRESFPSDRFAILSGSAHVTFAKIPPNGAVVHHVVVVPLEPQEIIIKDVIVDYTDAKSKDLKRVSASPLVRGYDHFLSEKALKDVLGVHPRHFLIFAAIALPLTVTSALFYSRSVSRYPIKKRQ